MVVGSGIDVRGIDVLGQIFDFSGIEKSEKSIKKTWQEFRDALSKGDFSFDDIASAKKNTFLRVYDDLFNKNAGIEYNTVLISEIEKYCVGRGTILGEDENPDFERFIPKTEFIKEDNRFSPSGVEWLYLAIGKEAAIHECAQAECRVKQNDRFGFCHFQFAADSTALKVVDLTIADEMTYKALNDGLETYGQEQVKKSIKKSKVLGFILRNNVNVEEFKKLFTKWGVYTYSKLLSEQIFEPLDEKDNKSLMYTVLIIDAKYYTNTTQVQFDKHTLHSNNLYQIFTYVKNREYQFGDEENKVSGMLLYARTDALIQPDNVYQMHGNQISVKTLDLNKPFDEIAKQLDEIAAAHFDGIEKTI